MFSDSHTHILNTKNIMQERVEERSGESLNQNELIDDPFEMMERLQKEKFRFIMDIGTEPGDLEKRMNCVKELSRGELPSFIHFSAGLWPHKQTIETPDSSLKMLEKDIILGLEDASNRASTDSLSFFALGECGLDRYWNGKDAPMLKEGGTLDIEGEEALFIEQLKMAKKYNLAVIIHSREAYKDTLKCIDKVGHHKGVIHCYSYGIDEGRTFLERGWYISFPGNITFPKTKTKIEAVRELVASIPLERLLLETDAPYMTPHPFRGKPNTSLYIKHTYEKASDYLDVSVQELCDVVYNNCCTLFGLTSKNI